MTEIKCGSSSSGKEVYDPKSIPNPFYECVKDGTVVGKGVDERGEFYLYIIHGKQTKRYIKWKI